MRHTFLMTVTGTFAAPVDSESIHCGPPLPKDRPDGNGVVRTFRWEVRMDARELDSDGFVMDNAVVKDYFEAIELIDMSCEVLCRQACRALWRDNFRQLTVKIWGADWANVECTMKG